MSDDKIVEVYSADDLMDAEHIRRVLAEEGIIAKVVGASLHGIIGDLPAQLATPRLWVHEEDFARGRQIIELVKQEQRERSQTRSPWKCVSCGEENSADFEICWSCQIVDETQD
ncbi:putative signal transducing protein [Thalassoglobus polymorphus]|nr:DUF2007 domain-containing protein [Thalassoglobus polymorphus]